MKMRMLVLLLLFVSLDSFSMYWAKGGKKPSRPKQQSNKIVSASQEKTATEKLQEFIDGVENITADDAEAILTTIFNLIKQGASPNIMHKNGITLLQLVVIAFGQKNFPLQYQEKILTTLINSGADVNGTARAGDRESVLITAVERKSTPYVLELLLKHGAEVDYKNRYGHTARDLAVMDGYNAAVDVIDAFNQKNKIR